jgi:hypothetical protein
VPVLGVDSAPDNLSSAKPWTCGVGSEDIENRIQITAGVRVAPNEANYTVSLSA